MVERRVGFARREQVLAAREFRKTPTPAEAVLWALVRRRQVDGFRFRRQHPCGPFVLDFFCAEANLAVEADGEVHRSLEAAHRDAQRTAWLQEAGIRVLRLRNELLENTPQVAVDLIRRALRSR